MNNVKDTFENIKSTFRGGIYKDKNYKYFNELGNWADIMDLEHECKREQNRRDGVDRMISTEKSAWAQEAENIEWPACIR